MLKPQRKIIRNEIKKDPLLSTLEKIESGFENNKKIVTNAGLLIIAFVVGIYVYNNKSRQNDLESNSICSDNTSGNASSIASKSVCCNIG